MSSLYKQGEDRKQQLLFPTSIDDYVDKDNTVRAIDDYVSILDLSKLGFTNTRTSNRVDGQKAYSPELLLKIYIYGYINKIRSSRMLQRECKRNIELLWLTQGLTPSYHTIADFRKNNPKALKQVFKEFVLLCKGVDLISGKLTAVDGAFMRANASKNQLIMKNNIEKTLEKINDKIDQYLTLLDGQDHEDKKDFDITYINNKTDELKAKKKKLDEDLDFLKRENKTQYNRTDPDARLMKKPAHNLMAYNTQIVVDNTFKFIVATDISTQGNDYQDLYKMAAETKEILGLDQLDITADKGYANKVELKKCIDNNINPIVPKANRKKMQTDKDKFPKDKFIYNKKEDHYICPNNQLLKKKAKQTHHNNVNDTYSAASAICKRCPIKEKCLPTKTLYKRLYRWEHEEMMEKHLEKMETDEAKAIMKKRGSIVEHPFGTIKRTLGWDHYLVRGKEKVSGENALIMLTYNFKRLLNLIGTVLFKKLIIAMKKGDIEQIREEIKAYILRCSLFIAYILHIIFMLEFYRGKYIKLV